MDSFIFEGDIQGISKRQLEFISSVLEDRGFKNDKVVIEPIGKPGDNYAANVKRIIVNKHSESFQMVAKIAPNSGSARTSMEMGVVKGFRYENFIYTVVLPKFVELENEVNVPKADRLKFATCYGSLMEEFNEIILLEDLKLSNFTLLDRLTSLTDESVKLLLRSFAILHSLSYVLKNEDVQTFDYFCSNLESGFEIMNAIEETKTLMTNLEKDIISLLDHEKHKKLVKNSITGLSQIALKNIKLNKKQKHSVINQGDAWTNNIMFRLEGERVVECCMIDYQIASQNTPVADLHYMIFNCTDYETRAKHYYEWIDYYHNQLDKSLANFGLKVNNFYTRDRLDADLRRQGKVSFGQSIMLASVLMRDTNDAAKAKTAFEKNNDFQEMMGMNLGEESTRRFKERVVGLIQSFIEFGYV